MGSNLSLRAKLLCLVLTVVVCFGAAVSVYVSTRVADDLDRELLKRGVSIAKHLAEISTEDFIEDNHLHLQYLAHDHQSTEADIRYILMLDQDGVIIAHSFEAAFPAELAAANHYANGEEAVTARLDTGSEVIYDIAVPVLDGRVGSVRIGLSAEPIHLAVKKLTREILVAIVMIGLLAFAITLPAAQSIVRPLSRLTRAIEELSKGRRDLQLPVDRRDEIGVLKDAFNQMTVDVRTAEKRLAAQVNFLQVLMEDLPVPVFYKDRELKMLGCNQAFAEFWGKPSAAIIGRTPEQLYPAADAAQHRAKDLEVLREGRAHVYEYTVDDAAGRRRDIVFRKAPFRDEEGQTAGIVGVMHDVTRQREADRSKSEFMSTVAHEFQTPLATILGFSELLQDNAILDEDERKTALQLIASKAEALSQMVNELLDMARLESGRPLSIHKEPCDLNQLLTESVDSFRKRLTTHRFAVALPATTVTIAADRQRVGQIVENLLSNAVKYSREASTIHVAAECRDAICRITVRDEGVGMSPSQLEHLFDKFYRVDAPRRVPGTGLGLFITKSIVDAHQGKIRIDSTPGVGTTVTVELPHEGG